VYFERAIRTRTLNLLDRGVELVKCRWTFLLGRYRFLNLMTKQWTPKSAVGYICCKCFKTAFHDTDTDSPDTPASSPESSRGCRCQCRGMRALTSNAMSPENVISTF